MSIIIPPGSSTRSSTEEKVSLSDPVPRPSATPDATMDLLRSMAAHSQHIRSFTPLPLSRSTSFASSSRRDSDRSDLESGGNDWAYFLSKRRQTRRSTYLLIAIIISSGLIYTFIDNYLLADWVSARSRFTPTYLGGLGEEIINIPDHPDPALDAAAWLGTGVTRIPNDESHVLIPNPPTLPVFNLLAPRRRFPSTLLIPLYASGNLPFEPLPPIPEPTLDVIYTFVNASSPILLEAKEIRMEKEGLGRQEGGAHHWRDNGELRGAIRSAALFLRDGLRRIHVISADFELDSVGNESNNGDGDDDEDADEDAALADGGAEEIAQWRIGQVPSWLDTSAKQTDVQWHFHSEIFRLPSDQGRLDQRLVREWQKEEAWRDESLPSFNSFQIEAKVGWVKDLSENFILSNDDMFFLRDLNPSDFHHPLLGTVFRVAPNHVLLVSPFLSPDLRSDPGEWGGLTNANFILSKRFYSKPRIYLSHVPKSMTRSMVHEASVMFASDLGVSATRGFRESTRGVGDVHFAWLVTHLQIERWREAVLWSWAVARLGGMDGVWGDDARDSIWNALRLSDVEGELPQQVVITQRPRSTMDDMDEMMHRNRWDFPEASEYQFTSLDGHLPFEPSDNLPPHSCVFSLSRCLPVDFFSKPTLLSATDMFTRFAFDQPGCGDCLLMALVNASGERGLSAILPHADEVFEPEKRERSQWERDEPMLPLVGRWQEGNFSLGAVIRPGQDRWDEERGGGDGPVRLLDFCVKLLSRYTYSIAGSPTQFGLARNPAELERVLESFKPTDDYAMGCINDDQPDSITGGESSRLFGGWMEGRFGGFEVGWEKADWPWSRPPDDPDEKEFGDLGVMKALLETISTAGSETKDSDVVLEQES